MNLNKFDYKIGDIKIENIMTSKIIYYDEAYLETLKQFCLNRNISFLPSMDGNYIFKLEDNEFKREKLSEDQKISYDNYIFDKVILEKFKNFEVLLVFNKNNLVGVIHFCDYNRDNTFIYLYSILLKFEKKLRQLLTANNFSNNDITPKETKEMKQLEPFQTFYISDLVNLIKKKNILVLPDEIRQLRNIIMHAKNPVKHENFETAGLIYNLESFVDFFDKVLLLEQSYKKVLNKINLIKIT